MAKTSVKSASSKQGVISRYVGIVGVIVIVIVAVIAISSGGNKKNSDSMHMPAASSSSSSSASTANATATDAVTLSNYAFGPMAITVKVGTKVTWTNMDDVHHSVTADTASADAPNGPLFGKGETYSFTFMKAGTYTYHCMPHPYMHGTVIVTN